MRKMERYGLELLTILSSGKGVLSLLMVLLQVLLQ